MTENIHRDRLDQIAQERFGYSDWRPGQLEAIQAVLAGQDTLAVMPTGSGKSAIYQMVALLMPGSTVVVSPLVALQRDQVKSITEQPIGDATLVNSAVSSSERQAAFEQLAEGDVEFLFLAPEQFNNSETLEQLQSAKPSLFVIDEAHCISTWGHDFRPDYLRLGQVIEALGHPRILALTATAAPLVQAEIVERLGMQDPNVIVEGFDRPNIDLSVERFEDDAEKQDYLIQQVVRTAKPGLVYTATRKRAELLAQKLQQTGVQAGFYHAGMKKAEREQTESAFMQDQLEVLVATTAFGMGVDKPNIRFVFHAEISDSLDSYYQEIGRAGRDGEPAQAILFYNPSDLNLKRFFAGRGQLNDQQVKQVLKQVRRLKSPASPKQLLEQTGLSKAKLSRVLSRLTEVGTLEALPNGHILPVKPLKQLKQISAAVMQVQEQRQQFEKSRLTMMQGFAEVRGCRRKYLLNYFGEHFIGPCNACDNCRAGITTEDTTYQPYALGARVAHKEWGEGTVMRYEGDKVVILFDQIGYKTLDIQTALLRKLLQRMNDT